MSEKRKVYFETDYIPDYDENANEVGGEYRKKGTGFFHEFSSQYQICGDVAISSPSAIIELEDGSLVNVRIENVRFING
jgi:hypothetical protein